MTLLLISPAPLTPLTALLPHLEAAPRPFAGAIRVVAEEALARAVETSELLIDYGIHLAGQPSTN